MYLSHIQLPLPTPVPQSQTLPNTSPKQFHGLFNPWLPVELHICVHSVRSSVGRGVPVATPLLRTVTLPPRRNHQLQYFLSEAGPLQPSPHPWWTFNSAHVYSIHVSSFIPQDLNIFVSLSSVMLPKLLQGILVMTGACYTALGLAWCLLHILSWLQTCSNPPGSASWVLRLQVWRSMPTSFGWDFSIEIQGC